MMARPKTQVVITGKKRDVCELFVTFVRLGWVRAVRFLPQNTFSNKEARHERAAWRPDGCRSARICAQGGGRNRCPFSGAGLNAVAIVRHTVMCALVSSSWERPRKN